MLDAIPVQFVEGVNEAAEQSYEDAIAITRFTGVGIEYTPTLSYLLTKLEIMLSFGNIPENAELGVQLCSDYEGKPSGIKLSSSSFAPKKVFGDWHEILLEPVSVIKDRKYWLVINPNRCPTAIIKAKTGNDCTFSVMRGEKWGAPTEEFTSGKVMVRFYGRIIPVSF